MQSVHSSEMGDAQYSKKLKQKPGILRLDISKPRRSSGGSVEFRNQPVLLGEDTQPSSISVEAVSPQLSVKWAFAPHVFDVSGKLTNSKFKGAQPSFLSSSSSRYEKQTNHRKRQNLTTSPDDYDDRCLNAIYIDSGKPLDTQDYINSEVDDYSISVSAVMQRRASTKGHHKKGYISPRRVSISMGHVIAVGGGAASAATVSSGVSFDRRRSSVYTTSSGDTAISMGDGTNNQESTKEQIFENIRLHKEVLQSVKLQPWSMRRKLRLVRQAKEYVARHEGALQERFAMSRSTTDLWARFKILLAARWQHYKRELVNISTVLIPWELRIKEIESHFGSVVASYFIFLRWLFWVNIVIAVVLTIFVVMPEFLATQWPPTREDHRKNMLPQEKANATRLISIWDFEGFLKYSPLFYGYYSDFSGAVRWHYDLPLAYFLTGLVVYIYSFWATLRKMAENSRMSKLSSKDDECVFSWKLFTGWDYMIGHAETAHNRIASVVLGFKEALLEEAEKKKDKRNWKIIVLRGIVNLLVLQLLAISAFAVVTVVNRSTEKGATDSYWRRNEITVVITAISFFFPMFFEGLGLLESYHPRKQLRMQLARIMALNLLNLYALIIALFDQIGAMNKTLICLKENITQSRDLHESQPITHTLATLLTTTNLLYQNQSTNIENNYFDMFLSSSVASDLTQVTSTTLIDLYDKSQTVDDYFTRAVPNNITHCYRVPVNCSRASVHLKALVASLLLLNLTAITILPKNVRMPIHNISTTNVQNNDLNVPLNYSNIHNASEYTNETIENITFSGLNDWYSNYSQDEVDDSGMDVWRVKRDEYINGTLYGNEDNNIYDAMSEIYASFSEYSTGNGTNEFPEVENRTVADVNATFSTYLTCLAKNVSFDNFTEYERFVNEAVAQFLVTEAEICYEMVCDDLEQTTLPYDEANTDTTSTAWDFDSTTAQPLFRDNYTLEFATSINLETTTASSIDFSTMEPENSTQVFHVHESLTKYISHMEPVEQLALRKLCWETMFGQELVKLTVMDLVATITSTIFMDFFRALFVRYFNKCWCWDLEKSYPKYGDFKIAENILHLVNNQGQVWMGMFFSPGLAILNLVKLVIIMYLRSWTVLTCNVPHEVVFRASRSNNFYLALLLTMLFLCVLPVGYAIVWLKPSWHCGPFSKYDRIYLIFTDTLRKVLPPQLHQPLDYIASPSTVIPLLLLLILIIYYLVSLTGALREANQDLRIQLRRERTEGRKKLLKLPKTDDIQNDGNPMDRWRKVLEASSPQTPASTILPAEQDDDKKHVRKELLARFMKTALRKGSNTSDDESAPIHLGDDETDTEQHESLPRDKEVRTSIPKMLRLKAAAHCDSINEKIPVDQLSRKTSMAQMLKMTARKEANEHPAGRFKIEKVATAKPTTAWIDDKCKSSSSPTLVPPSPVKDEELDRTKVVVGRRRSILLRQNNLIESGPSPSTGDNKDDSVNYKVINEKNKEMEKRAKNKTTKPAVIVATDFPYDQTEGDVSDDDNTSYRQIEFKSVKSSQVTPSNRIKCQSSSDTSWNQDTEDTCRESISPVRTRRDSSPVYAVIVKKKPSEDKRIHVSTAAKPKRRFNTFLTLVREVINIRRQEHRGVSKARSDLSRSVCEDDEYDTNGTIKKRGSRKSNKQSKTASKRQDSQASIWSDNIPVITISKTESDECILESLTKPVLKGRCNEKEYKESQTKGDD